jgi:hypothetical protein
MKKLGIAGWGLIFMLAIIAYYFFKDPMDVGYIVELKTLGVMVVVMVGVTLFYKFIYND